MSVETCTTPLIKFRGKPLQEHSRSCRASGARPAGPLTRPHRKAFATGREERPISRLQHLREPDWYTHRCSGATVGDSHEGPLKNRGGSCLKPAKNAKRKTHLEPDTTHARTTRPTPQWPPRPTRAGQQGTPRARSASLEGSCPPRTKSPSLEGSRSLERAPPRSRVPASLKRALPRSRFPHEHTCSRTRVQAFNALTRQSRAITPWRCSANSLEGAHPRSPPLWGTVRRGRCQLRDTVPPTLVRLTRHALEGGSDAPSSPPLVTLQGQTVTSGRRERHPRHCQPCAAIPAPAAPRRALLQLLRRC
jgi:hypothetical protein